MKNKKRKNNDKSGARTSERILENTGLKIADSFKTIAYDHGLDYSRGRLTDDHQEV
jgi:hypothetical protein